jgi:hypothetical protein
MGMTFLKTALAIVGVSTVALGVAPADAQRRGGWETIGSREVNGGVDRDTIAVRGNERFRAIRLCANRRPVRLIDADVVFANGSTQDMQAASLLSAGECTRPLNLNGKRRDISQVKMTYAKFRIFSRPPLLTVQAR